MFPVNDPSRPSAEQPREQSGLATSTAAGSAVQDRNTGAASTTLTMDGNTQPVDGSRPAAEAANYFALPYGSTASNNPTTNVPATLDIARYYFGAPTGGPRGSWRANYPVTYNNGGVASLASVSIGIEQVNSASPSRTSVPGLEVGGYLPLVEPSAESFATDYSFFDFSPIELEPPFDRYPYFARYCLRRRFGALHLSDTILHRRARRREQERLNQLQSSKAAQQKTGTLDDDNTLPDCPPAPQMSRAQPVERNSSYTVGRGPPLVEQSAGSSAGNSVLEDSDPRVPRWLTGRGARNPRPHEENQSLQGRGISKSSATSQTRRFQ
ncbi:hypothetical protein BZA77DRAFT_296016 [Pyronema omphalodes]|nr:hypothetical protein BZA77DRAFT_362914 [Pyronema omphalodes]KAI5813426.1 hypothetical protein BZA77DRAFT_296016 [Pyronema omphalodes]